MKVSGFIYGRNDAKNLDLALYSLHTQGLDTLVYVDDGSTDESVKVALSNGATVIHAREPGGESRIGTPRLSWTANEGLKYMKDVDYFIISGSDIWLPQGYVDTIVDLMEHDSLLVMATGIIEGENYNPLLPKGAGRVHRASWWWKYIGTHPFCWLWESYAVYKALSLGFKCQSIPSLKMKTMRPSAAHTNNKIRAMRQLGVFPPYALLRAFRLARAKGVTTYLRSSDPIVDQALAFRTRMRNCKRILFGKKNIDNY